MHLIGTISSLWLGNVPSCHDTFKQQEVKLVTCTEGRCDNTRGNCKWEKWGEKEEGGRDESLHLLKYSMQNNQKNYLKMHIAESQHGPVELETQSHRLTLQYLMFPGGQSRTSK